MNTKLLMTISALTMGVAGIALSFLPHELLSYLGPTSETNLEPLILQILGALYFAFAMVNWTSKANLIGGIYSRPIAIGNLTHFLIGALALIKGYSSNHETVILILSVVYTVFAMSFAIVFFKHPVKAKIE
jgi:Na+-driven multidrug efflux pump